MLCEVLLHHAALARRNPELNFGASSCHLDQSLEVPEPLDVTAVVPAEVIAFLAFEHEDDGVHPLRVSQRRKTLLLGPLHVAEHVAPFEGVTVRAHRTPKLDQDRPNGAVLGWDAVRVARHL